MEEVLKLLADAKLSAKVKKCKFAYQEIIFVGHLIKDGKIMPDPSKLDAVALSAVPSDIPTLRSFIGLVNYYRRFIPHFAIIAAPLYFLLRATTPWTWGATEMKAYDDLKAALTKAPCLHGPDFSLPFVLQTDASGVGIGAVLAQTTKEGETHPVAYISRQLNVAEKNYSGPEQECLAVVWAISQFEHYLIDAPFTIVTDHSALQWLPSKRFENKRFLTWAMRLNEFKFKVVHRKGRNNANADYLSRNPIPGSAPPEPYIPYSAPMFVNSACFSCSPFLAPSLLVDAAKRNTPVAASSSSPSAPPADSAANNSGGRASDNTSVSFELVDLNRLEAIVAEQHNDPRLQTIIRWLSKKEMPAEWDSIQIEGFQKRAKNFVLHTDTTPSALYYLPENPRRSAHVFVPLTPRLVIPAKYQKDLIQLFHDSAFGGHLGIVRTLRKLSVLYYWNTMFKDVDSYVKHCQACQTLKQRKRDPEHMKHPIGIPTEPFELISMDFVGPIADAGESDYPYILTFVDHFTRWGIAIPMREQSALNTALAFFNEVICRYGCPRRLLSDQGSAFNSAMLSEVCALMQVNKIFSPTYRPESNGMVERFNGTLKQLLRLLTGGKDWVRILQAAVFAYNTAMSETIGVSPFEALFGRPARYPFSVPSTLDGPPSTEEPMDVWVRELKLRMQEGTQYMLAIADTKQHKLNQRNLEIAHFPIFAEGAQVWLYNRTAPTVRRGALTRPVDWTGPYVIVKRRGDTLYVIRPVNAPARGASREETVHITRLKKYAGELSAPTDLYVSSHLPVPVAPSSDSSSPFIPPSTVSAEYFNQDDDEEPEAGAPRLPSKRTRQKLPACPADESSASTSTSLAVPAVPSLAVPSPTMPALSPAPSTSAPMDIDPQPFPHTLPTSAEVDQHMDSTERTFPPSTQEPAKRVRSDRSTLRRVAAQPIPGMRRDYNETKSVDRYDSTMESAHLYNRSGTSRSRKKKK